MMPFEVPLRSSEPFAIFQSVLDNFPHLLDEAHQLRTTKSDDPLSLKAAVIGFAQFHPIQAWSKANFEYIDGLLNAELSPDTFSPSPECAEGITVFAGLGFGVLLGLFNADLIDNGEAARNEWYLFAFLNVHGQEICDTYKTAERGLKSSLGET